MRALKTIGMLFILGLAISALASTTASAALPEFLDNVPGNTFTGTSGEGKLEDPATKLAIVCKKDDILLEGNEVTGAKTLTLGVHFEGCTVAGLSENSLGDKSGVLLVKATGELCYISKAEKHLGIFATITPVHVEVPTLGELFEIKGTLLGLLGGTKSELKTTGYTITINATTAAEKCEGRAAGQLLLEKEHNGKPLAATESTTEAITFDKDFEVMA